MSQRIFPAESCTGEASCSCVLCSPVHISKSIKSVGTPTRLRYLLLNWVNSSDILKPHLPEKAKYFETCTTKVAALDRIFQQNHPLTSKALGIQDKEDIKEVVLQIGTMKLEDGYGVLAVAVCNDETHMPYAFGTKGQLMVSFLVKFRRLKNGKTLEEMKDWNAIVGLLREATALIYDENGEQRKTVRYWDLFRMEREMGCGVVLMEFDASDSDI